MPFTTTDNLLLSALLPTAASGARLAAAAGTAEQAALNWAEVVRRAEELHLAPLLRAHLARIGALAVVPANARTALDESSRTWAARHLAYVSEARRLLDALKQAGIAALPLKGAALMLGGYYPQAGLRPALDLDLLVDPARIEMAAQVAEGCGYHEIPGRRAVRPRGRLENEQNHLWPRRGPSGLLLELHRRAFHFASGSRDFGFVEMNERAVSDQTSTLRLPAPADLAVHLIHHTLVDLQSTHAVLRTLADLHFVFAQAPTARAEAIARATELGFGGAARLAEEALAWLANGTQTQAEPTNEDVRLLIETALLDAPAQVAEAARLLEYFAFGRQPFRKAGNLLALLFTSRSHLEQLYRPDKSTAEGNGVYLNYLRRPFDLLRRIDWSALRPTNLARVRRLRNIAMRER